MLAPHQVGNSVLVICFAQNDKFYQPAHIFLWRLHLKIRFLKHGSTFPYGVHLGNFILYFQSRKLYIYTYIYLLTAIGLSLGGSTHLHTNITQNNTNNNRTTQKTTNVEECGPCPVFLSLTLAFPLKLRKKHRKSSVRVRKTSVSLRKPVTVQYTYYQNTHTLILIY